MLRRVKIQLLQRNLIVTEFCCSRIVFSGVGIKLPDIKLLFDQEFISEIKKYKRKDLYKESTRIINAVCVRCGGYGFLDWVSNLQQDGEDEGHFIRPDPNAVVVVKNENPIKEVFFRSEGRNVLHIYYASYFDPEELQSRCWRCFGVGLAFEHNPKPISAEDLINSFQKLNEPKSEIMNLFRYIKRRTKCLIESIRSQ